MNIFRSSCISSTYQSSNPCESQSMENKAKQPWNPSSTNLLTGNYMYLVIPNYRPECSSFATRYNTCRFIPVVYLVVICYSVGSGLASCAIPQCLGIVQYIPTRTAARAQHRHRHRHQVVANPFSFPHQHTSPPAIYTSNGNNP